MKAKSRAKTAVLIVITVILLVFSLFPLIYMVIQSLMPWDQVDKSMNLSQPTLRSYQYLLGVDGSTDPMMWIRALLNSIIVSLPTAIISVLVGLCVGYSVTKLQFTGKKFIYQTLLFQMFFPVVILLVPRYILIKPLANHYLGMILPLCISTWAIFMYINYFTTLPNEIFEVAKIDGLSDFGIIVKIAVPMTKSVTTIVFLSMFMSRWNELMWDMLVAPDIKMQTLNVLISTQFRSMGNFPGPMYAASVLLTLPIIIMFLCASKYFKEGISFMLK
ncbi:MAG: ABC transmembrane type-1 domain-containing protein [Thermocaproicibacter melissae]|jgi:multiple sugar transport system permease protein|uniref:carbohydrate ABC transporter permease n=1 Tax=Thermocaproicibacter melissae TaxID=2966552 RepID=UPI003A103A62